MEAMKNAANYVGNRPVEASYGASKEANKNVTKTSEQSPQVEASSGAVREPNKNTAKLSERPRTHNHKIAPKYSDAVQDKQLATLFEHQDVIHEIWEAGSDINKRPQKISQRWKRERKLGSGTFGDVFLEVSVDKRSSQARAVKEIKVQSHAGDGIEDLIVELEALAKFSAEKYKHLFVYFMGWYRDGLFGPTLYIAMEYFEHGDLRHCLDNKTLPEEEARSITFQVLEGLAVLHASGYVHRDLKPQNLLVASPGPEWWIKIGDFGVSKRLQALLVSVQSLVLQDSWLLNCI
ncbi:serine/threonine protein kinase [Exophiala aquamarina CBS 119918]|uniref:mitogen-activated protein kinase n=1 Tax=Exophiala aquamarina CBS 119918 TaxID=1182545 RepID=A0A072P9W0_9EURO|nr:serine/threonine protein kinase [Exophiala aquamarina CBS 119918]KEF56894.1 serine/threonine protein kinase [Exophiala aquamarina CBS 119918]